jgi:hypothetical protein
MFILGPINKHDMDRSAEINFNVSERWVVRYSTREIAKPQVVAWFACTVAQL